MSTWIQELLNDENFTAQIQEGLKITEYKGAPIKAIIGAQIRLALNGDTKAFDALSKYGFGTKVEQNMTGEQRLIIETRRHDDDGNADD